MYSLWVVLNMILQPGIIIQAHQQPMEMEIIIPVDRRVDHRVGHLAVITIPVPV